MRSLNSLPNREAGFVEPMECLAVAKVPSGPEWVYEIKLDGYRALAINSSGRLSLYSRRRKPFDRQYQHIFNALCDLPENTVVDGEIVALDDLGRPDFNLLQHSRSQASRICYFVFDQLVCQNRDVTQLPLVERREILRSNVKFQSPRILIAEYFETSAETISRAPVSRDWKVWRRSGRTVCTRRESVAAHGLNSG
jgi:ATP-dependent DNA ligase